IRLLHLFFYLFFFSSRRRHTRCYRDWSSDVCSSDLLFLLLVPIPPMLPHLNLSLTFLSLAGYLQKVFHMPLTPCHSPVQDSIMTIIENDRISQVLIIIR